MSQLYNQVINDSEESGIDQESIDVEAVNEIIRHLEARLDHYYNLKQEAGVYQ